MVELDDIEAEATATLLRSCATQLRAFAERSQPSPLGINASAGPAAWHAAREPQIDKVKLRVLAYHADAVAKRLGTP